MAESYLQFLPMFGIVFCDPPCDALLERRARQEIGMQASDDVECNPYTRLLECLFKGTKHLSRKS